MKILAQIGDLGGCYQYRVRIPFAALNKYDVSVDCYPFLPNRPGEDQFKTLVALYSPYDAVIVQRCYMYSIVAQIKKACEFLGIPMIFETDDDYLNLPKHNPAYLAVIHPDFFKVSRTEAEIEHERLRSLEGYRKILEMADLITVSTEELKRTLAPYNNNIVVLQNNVETSYLYRDHNPEHAYVCHEEGPNKGKMILDGKKHGLWSIPDHFIVPDKNDNRRATAFQTPRIGYSGTVSHQGHDFKTVEYYWEKLVLKRSKECWFVYMGDQYFWKKHVDLKKYKKVPDRNIYIPQYEYSLYMYNYRNLDIAIAPLYPNIFNMSKSDIKAVEAASWGIPCVLPNYVTYNRNFVHGETCFLYDNGKEFYEYIELLLGDPKLRSDMGQKALQYVTENRLERLHAKERYEAYKSVIDKSYRLNIFHPEVSDETGPK